VSLAEPSYRSSTGGFDLALDRYDGSA